VVVFCPSAESCCLAPFGPINDCIPQNSTLSIPILCLVDPDVEASCSLHVNSPSDKVSHHFLAETLHLRKNMVLVVVSVCEVILVLSDCFRMFILTPFQLVDVVFEKLLSIFCDHLLPFNQCRTTHVTVDSVNSAVKEFLT